jgi:hypothetical protein
VRGGGEGGAWRGGGGRGDEAMWQAREGGGEGGAQGHAAKEACAGVSPGNAAALAVASKDQGASTQERAPQQAAPGCFHWHHSRCKSPDFQTYTIVDLSPLRSGALVWH